MIAPDQIKLAEGDTLIVTTCLELTVYTDMPFFEAGPGIVRFYNIFRKEFGSNLTFYATQSLPRVKPVDKRVLEMVPFWFAQKPWRRVHYGLTLYSGRSELDARPPAFEIFGSTVPQQAGFVRMILPPEIISGSTDLFLNLAMEVMGTFPWLSGYGGYAFFWLPRFVGRETKIEKYVGPKLLRHPGINMGEPMHFKKFALNSVLGANWLTLLNQSLCEQLGGFSAIRNTLSSRIDIQELQSGVLLRAGQGPETGDVNRDQLLPLYREISRLLKSIRTDRLRPLTGLSAENTVRWLERFDD